MKNALAGEDVGHIGDDGGVGVNMTKPAATVRVIIYTCICLCPSVQMESDGWFFVVMEVSVMVISGGMVREMKRQIENQIENPAISIVRHRSEIENQFPVNEFYKITMRALDSRMETVCRNAQVEIIDSIIGLNVKQVYIRPLLAAICFHAYQQGPELPLLESSYCNIVHLKVCPFSSTRRTLTNKLASMIV
ncbi:hypothetical protein L2E82_48338 [Cichorium intybus]|uniref:Uncharacterized protein n=1 Tax=Cichorium intybus TaxID=13427 RepID=A0ACB8YY71_CICIN|nr:hypothetical protein L2E82_48338 [Cichorium intybus]